MMGGRKDGDGLSLRKLALFICMSPSRVPYVNMLMKAIAERGRYESLPIFFGRDAIDLQLSIDHAHWRVKSRN